MKPKGQYLSLEQMILFTISIVIMVTVYYSYSTLSDQAGSSIGRNQMEEVSEIVMSGVYRTYNSYDSGADYKKIEIKIPREISEDMYKIKTEGDEIVVYNRGGLEVRKKIGEITQDVTFDMHEEFKTGVTSRKGSIFIELENNVIKIGR